MTDAPDIISHITVLIDESGSMSDVRDETINAYNGFVDAIRAEQVGKKAFLSTYRFDLRADGTGTLPVLRPYVVNAAIAAAPPLARNGYDPGNGGVTPLYDAVCLAIADTDADVKTSGATRVTFLIQTDGYENASKRFRHANVRELIDARTKAGWQFVFLGADLADAKAIGINLGMASSNSMSYAKGASTSVFAGVATSTQAYRRGGSAEIDPAT